MALPSSAGNGGVPVGPVASTQLLFTSLAAYFDFSAQPRPLEDEAGSRTDAMRTTQSRLQE